MHCLLCHQHFFEKVSWQYVFQLQSASLLCPPCKEQFELISGDCCQKCSRPLAKLDAKFHAGNICTDCERWNKEQAPLEKNYSIFTYNEFLQDVLAKWKYRGDTELTKIFIPHLKTVAKQLTVDAAIPIPLSRNRLYERSFNQAKLLADALPFPVIEVLEKRTDTKKQSKKKRHERLQIENNFSLSPCNLTNKTILLVDDIYTTGATLQGAAKVLKDHGAKKVLSMTVARG